MPRWRAIEGGVSTIGARCIRGGTDALVVRSDSPLLDQYLMGADQKMTVVLGVE